MTLSLSRILQDYDADAPLESACTIPGSWYVDSRVADLEARAVFGRTWQYVGRVEQVREAGQFLTADVAGEPVLVVRGRDGVLRAFFNVCRHHAAAVVTQPQGKASVLRCPYHGWTYSPEGGLNGAPEFDGVCNFDKAANGLVPMDVETWEQFVFVRIERGGPGLDAYLGGMVPAVAALRVAELRFLERRTYELACNWKVFVDNYLDGGYHVPHIHKGLGSVLNYTEYKIETRDRYCVQSSPITSDGGELETAAVRGGSMAYYYWLYPNFMLNSYEGVMDTNLVLPLGVDRCRVIFDFYFAESGDAATQRNRQSIAVSERIQQEDIDICESVQRGLHSRAYHTGRLSVRREGGEHLFHRLLAADLREMARECAD